MIYFYDGSNSLLVGIVEIHQVKSVLEALISFKKSKDGRIRGESAPIELRAEVFWTLKVEWLEIGIVSSEVF